jgi:hypothetical protein
MRKSAEIIGGFVATRQETSDPIITIKLRKGLADRNRLPLGDFLTVLEEFRQMVVGVGKKIQRERGAAFPDGDFGLEIVAGTGGRAVRPGSVWSPVAITANSEVGVLAAQEVIRTLDQLEREEGVVDFSQQWDRDLIRRVSRVARIQKRDRLELEVSIQRPGDPDPVVATFGAAGIASIHALQTPTFEVGGLSIYGKLVELLDRDPADEGGKGFWGELRRDNGESWRVQFRPADLDKVTPLFRKQVLVTGVGVYYRVASPKIIADSISVDSERDYESAFEEMLGNYRDVMSADALQRLREGE